MDNNQLKINNQFIQNKKKQKNVKSRKYNIEEKLGKKRALHWFEVSNRHEMFKKIVF